MSDLISRSALLNELNKMDAEYGLSFTRNMGATVITKAPAVDAVPVVHRRWELCNHQYGFLRCSECHEVYIYEEWLKDGKWNYCPNCGAKMDGDGKI